MPAKLTEEPEALGHQQGTSPVSPSCVGHPLFTVSLRWRPVRCWKQNRFWFIRLLEGKGRVNTHDTRPEGLTRSDAVPPVPPSGIKTATVPPPLVASKPSGHFGRPTELVGCAGYEALHPKLSYEGPRSGHRCGCLLSQRSAWQVNVSASPMEFGCIHMSPGLARGNSNGRAFRTFCRASSACDLRVGQRRTVPFKRP